jgi:hypothetical protein
MAAIPPPCDGLGPPAARVTATGLALVHENEVVLAAAGSAAQADHAVRDAGTVVEFHFPVEIEVRRGVGPVDERAIALHALDELARALRAT